MRKWIGATGALVVAATLSAGLPGCGGDGGGQEATDESGTVIVNPSPESLEPEQGID